MRASTLFPTIYVLQVFGQNIKCDPSADVVFVQDLQSSMRRSLKEIEDDVEDVMDELKDYFRRPRFGVITFREVGGTGCVDIPVPLTQSEETVEDTYDRLTTDTTPSSYGNPLSGLEAALTWSEVGWQSTHRIIILLTNNLPIAVNDTVPANADDNLTCYKSVQSPEEAEILKQIKQAGVTVFFVIPRAANEVVTYWRRFNNMLSQNPSHVTTSTHDLDDYFKDRDHLFDAVKDQNCSKKTVSLLPSHPFLNSGKIVKESSTNVIRPSTSTEVAQLHSEAQSPKEDVATSSSS